MVCLVIEEDRMKEKTKQPLPINMVDVNLIISNGNIRSGDKSRTKEYARVKENIKADGKVLRPVLCYLDENNAPVLIDGHQRVQIAKELEIPNVPVSVIDKPDDIRRAQLICNMYTVKMTLYEQIMVYSHEAQKAVDEGKGMQDLADQFGHSLTYMKKRIKLANLHPKLLTKNISEDELNDLSVIAEYDISIQDRVVKRGKTLWSIKNELKRLCPSERLFKENFKPKALKLYYDAYEGTNKQQSLVLFTDTIVYDLGFFIFCLRQQHPEVMSLLEELPVDENTYNYDVRYNTSIKDVVSFKNPKAWLNKVTGWNADFNDPYFYGKVTKSKSPKKEGRKYQGVDNKFAKVVHLIIESELEIVDTKMLDKKGFNIVYNWLVTLKSYSVNLVASKEVAKSKTEPVNVFNDLIHYWFHAWNGYATFNEIDKLFKMIGFSSIKEMVFTYYKTSEQFRKDVLSCFTTAHLKTIIETPSKKKSDIVDDIAMTTDSFPKSFLDLFGQENVWKEANFRDSVIK